MSAALKYAPSPQSSIHTQPQSPPTPANDNCHLHLFMTEVYGNAVTYLHTGRHCRGLLQLDLIHRIKSLGYAQPFAKHPGSLAAGTNASGTSLWIEQPKTTSSLSLRAHSTPFGETLINNSANDDQAGFTGHIKDKATGLNYMQVRYQDPVIGRFLSIDPVGFSPGRTGSFNRYSYTENDPINATDPDGKKFKIEGPKQFKKEVKQALKQFKKSSKSNRTAYRTMKKSKHTITIKPRQTGNQGNNTVIDNKTDASNGTGSGSTIRVDVTDNVTRNQNGTPSQINGVTDNRPGEIGLGHELGHAHDAATGTYQHDSLSNYANPAGFIPPGITPTNEVTPLKFENDMREKMGVQTRPCYTQKC